jgi:hypothetical protein
MDGRSLLGLLAGNQVGWPQDRAIEIEFKEKGVPSELSASCTFAAVRTVNEIYVEHTSVPEANGQSCRPADEGEHYDLGNDPFQLDNLFPAQPGSPAAQAQEALKQRLDQLRSCTGIEGRDPQPAGGFYCEGAPASDEAPWRSRSSPRRPRARRRAPSRARAPTSSSSSPTTRRWRPSTAARCPTRSATSPARARPSTTRSRRTRSAARRGRR